MNRRGHAGKVDQAQAPIVEALLKLGCSVQSLAQVGDGCPDLLIGVAGINFLLEIKEPNAQFTDAQKKWHRDWKGRAHVCRSIDDAQAVTTFYRGIAAKLFKLTLEPPTPK